MIPRRFSSLCKGDLIFQLKQSKKNPILTSPLKLQCGQLGIQRTKLLILTLSLQFLVDDQPSTTSELYTFVKQVDLFCFFHFKVPTDVIALKAT